MPDPVARFTEPPAGASTACSLSAEPTRDTSCRRKDRGSRPSCGRAAATVHSLRPDSEPRALAFGGATRCLRRSVPGEPKRSQWATEVQMTSAVGSDSLSEPGSDRGRRRGTEVPIAHSFRRPRIQMVPALLILCLAQTQMASAAEPTKRKEATRGECSSILTTDAGPIPSSATSLFAAANGQLGVYDPVSSSITYFDPTESGTLQLKRQVDLEKRTNAPGGSVLPDLVAQTSDGGIVLLSRELRDLTMFDAAGRVRSVVGPSVGVPWWFTYNGRDSALVYGYDLESAEAGYEGINLITGQVERPLAGAWVEVPYPGSDAAATIFHSSRSFQAEFAVHFPYFRVVSDRSNLQVDLRQACHCLSPLLLADLEELEGLFGMPAPLGTGLKDEARLAVVFLDIAADGDQVWALVNGRVLLTLTLPDKIQCAALKSEGEWREAALLQVAEVGGRLLLLERQPGGDKQRVVWIAEGAGRDRRKMMYRQGDER